jgi:gamma-glutamyltranspeptidase / glutathione hydrolase
MMTPSGSVASQGMVTGTTGAGAMEAGVEMLKQGGSAADAVIATALTQVCLAAGSWVSYAGIWTMVYFDAASGRVHNLNAAFNTVKGETEPLGIPGINLSKSEGGGTDFSAFASPTPSGRTALTPGFMAGIDATHQRFGKLPLSAVFAPAIRCAEEGFTWSEGLARQYAFRAPVLTRLPETRAIFHRPDGSPYEVGDTFKQPALAKTLRRTVQQGVRNYLYTGEWAQRLVGAVQRDGGCMTLSDLADYAVEWCEPVRGAYHGFDVYVHGLPANGGVNLIEALNLADLAQISKLPYYAQSPEALYWIAQISKLAILLDPSAAAFMTEHKEALSKLDLDLSLSARLTKTSARKVWDTLRAGRIPGVSAHPTNPAHSDSIVAVDRWGNIAAVVHSINAVSWGGTGINVDGISIPDSASFQQPGIAAVGPGARLPDPTNPGVVLKDGEPLLGFGSIGSGLHIRTLACLIGVLDFGLTPQEAINAPSLGMFNFVGAKELTVGTKEFSEEYLQSLRGMGLPVVESDPLRGYWLGIQIDGATRELRGGTIRELALGGRAVGY